MDYKEELKQIALKGKRVYYSNSQSLSIVEELNRGLEDFLLNQRKNDIEAEMELEKIIIY
jgi:hypothetical protein